ncbi:uncharacterized protein LOC135114498 [Scylla paramamosain]|uniref:uncharacterized protein LOC135114498 n=1 Tax=Scylla paramamosain TaxID=85552 RepID=UPI0030827107
MRVEFLCFMVAVAAASLVSGVGVRHTEAIAGRAAAALLETTTETSCTLLLFTDKISTLTVFPDILEVWRRQWGVTVFTVEANSIDFNVTRRFSLLVPLARQVRQLSWCATIVVVSRELAFLTAFAEWSLRGRLLVWATKLVVLTRLPLPQLHALLSAYWTFSMMNTVFLNMENNYSK